MEKIDFEKIHLTLLLKNKKIKNFHFFNNKKNMYLFSKSIFSMTI